VLDVLHPGDSAVVRGAGTWDGRGGFLADSACIAKCGKAIEGEKLIVPKPLINRNSYRQLDNDNRIQ